MTRSSRTPSASPRSVVLVTGMSGTGKSSALAELARRGHHTVDTDDPGWIAHSQTPDGLEPVWDLERVGARLDRHRDGWLFVAGCVANQRALYDRFDAVVLLSAPLDVLLERVSNRANPFGSSAEDRAKIASDLAAYEPLLRAGADHEIVTTAPIAEVASALERVARAGRDPARSPASTDESPAEAWSESSMDADENTFSALFERHRRALQAHCYRMVGSLEDAEDLVQETFARAWRARKRFRREGRWSLRAWLFRIATNACLDHLARRAPRLLPADVASAADPEAEVPPVASEVAWLDPYPDRLVDPHEVATARETLEIAFVAAIQHLPPRQRAALILRDAAGFSARETAALLDISVSAANSALQRARQRLRERLPSRRLEWVRAATAEEQEIARRYIAALERRDFSALAALVRADARFSFPPRTVWYDGLDAFRRASDKHAAAGEHLIVPAAANLQPAFAIYLRAPGERRYRPLALAVVRVEQRRVVEVIHWDRPELFEAFGLPMSFPPSRRSNEEVVNAKEVR